MKNNSLFSNLEHIIASTHLLAQHDDPDRVLNALGDEKPVFEGALAYLRGDFEHTIRCYRKVEMDEAAKLCSCPLGLAAAISLGDEALFSEMEEYLKRIISSGADDNVKSLAELALNTAYASALIPGKVSGWLKEGDFDALHMQARQAAAYLRAKYFQSLGDYSSMLITAQTALNLCDSGKGVLFSGVYLRMACAIACHYLERGEEAKHYIRGAMAVALPYGIITPFAKSAATLGGLLEQCLEQKFPAYYNDVIGQWKRTFTNWVAFHNKFTEGNITQDLSLRDYQIALLVAQRVPAAKIARQLNISVGRVNNIIQEIYGTLFVHNRNELAEFILVKT